MAADEGPMDGLQRFAEANGLSLAPTATLPTDGAMLGREGSVEGAIEGNLPGGLHGTLAHYTYTYTTSDSDGHHTTHHAYYTIVVGRVPESIGFAPYLSYQREGGSWLEGGAKRVKAVSEAIKDADAYAYEGTSESWLTQLFSPAFIDWLGRSPDGFAFELSGGVLCVGRDNYLTDPSDLSGLCTDTAHVAEVIRKESLEGAESGAAASEGAHSKALDPKDADAIADVVGDAAPEYLGATRGAFRGHLFASPGTYATALLWALVVAAILNVFLLAITINLVANHSYTGLVIFEGALLLVCFLIALRWRVRDQVSVLDPQAFFRGYASSRHLKVEDPLQFAATHAEAKLPFEPEWVFTGALPGGGGDGALALKGDGTKRDDRIAVVAGPSGPVASAELRAEAPGLSAAGLDAYAGQLSNQLAGTPAPAG